MDGTMSAAIARAHFLKEEVPEDRIELIPVFLNNKYEKYVEMCRGKDVYILDISLNLETLMKIKEVSNFCIILDHHKTAETMFKEHGDKLPLNVFDMDRAACQITYDWFNSGDRPWIVEYIADRDLWKFEQPNSKSVSAALYWKYGPDIDKLTQLYTNPDSVSPDELAKEGEQMSAMMTLLCQKIANSAMNGVHKSTGHKVSVVECSHIFASEVGHILSSREECDFAILVREDLFTGHKWISLRGDGSIDLSVIAKSYGGGGHAAACGCTWKRPLTEYIDFSQRW